MCSMQRTTKTTKQTAAEAYAVRHAECAGLLKRIAAQLKEHRNRQTVEPRNWGYAGDLDYAAEQLAYVLAHLGDRSVVDQKGLAW
jgi:hypothetical protein